MNAYVVIQTSVTFELPQYSCCVPGYSNWKASKQTAPNAITPKTLCSYFITHAPLKVDFCVKNIIFFKCLLIHDSKSLYTAFCKCGSHKIPWNICKIYGIQKLHLLIMVKIEFEQIWRITNSLNFLWRIDLSCQICIIFRRLERNFFISLLPCSGHLHVCSPDLVALI